MPGYVIAEVEVTDPAGFEEYRKQVGATLQKYGGRYVVRGGACQLLEGDRQPARIVVIEFASVEQARRWYDCEEYRGPRALRMKTARSRLLLVEGVSS
jgi:uncharacterized protein (DUF1330 family)